MAYLSLNAMNAIESYIWFLIRSLDLGIGFIYPTITTGQNIKIELSGRNLKEAKWHIYQVKEILREGCNIDKLWRESYKEKQDKNGQAYYTYWALYRIPEEHLHKLAMLCLINKIARIEKESKLNS